MGTRQALVFFRSEHSSGWEAPDEVLGQGMPGSISGYAAVVLREDDKNSLGRHPRRRRERITRETRHWGTGEKKTRGDKGGTKKGRKTGVCLGVSCLVRSSYMHYNYAK